MGIIRSGYPRDNIFYFNILLIKDEQLGQVWSGELLGIGMRRPHSTHTTVTCPHQFSTNGQQPAQFVLGATITGHFQPFLNQMQDRGIPVAIHLSDSF